MKFCFIASLSEIDCVYSIPENTYLTQKKVTSDLQNTFESLKKIHLDIKSTVWMAGTTELPKTSFYKKTDLKTDSIFRNIKIALPLQNYMAIDFIGPDMDIGFRVAKYAYPHKVVLSSDFAYLLLKMKKPKGKKSIEENMKVVSFELLKGVWNGFLYPIIWYYPDWKSIDRDFYYADHKNNDIVEKVLLGRAYPLNKLESVYEELGKTEYIENLIDSCISLFPTKDKKTPILSI